MLWYRKTLTLLVDLEPTKPLWSKILTNLDNRNQYFQNYSRFFTLSDPQSAALYLRRST